MPFNIDPRDLGPRRTQIIDDQFMSIPVSEFESYIQLTDAEKRTLYGLVTKEISRTMLRQDKFEAEPDPQYRGLESQILAEYDREISYLQHLSEKIGDKIPVADQNTTQ